MPVTTVFAMSQWTKRLALLAGALTVAGCSTVPGTAVPDERMSEPMTSAAFGDLRTIDPCTLTDTALFAEHGEARHLARTWMDSCQLVVHLGEGDNITLDIGLMQQVELLPSGHQEVRELPRDTAILEIPTQLSDACVMALLLADDIAVRADAQPVELDESLRDAACELARTAVEGIFDIAHAGKVGHWEPPMNSLARQSACGLLPPEEVARLLGITADVVTLYPAEHQCRWGRTGGDTATAKLDFPVGKDREAAGISEGYDVEEEIGGRHSWIAEIGAGAIEVCNVATEHIEYALGEQNEREYVVLRISVPTTLGKDACTVARELAALAWPRLPTP